MSLGMVIAMIAISLVDGIAIGLSIAVIFGGGKK